MAGGGLLHRLTSAVEIARQEWADGHRRLEAQRDDPGRYRVLHAQADAIAEQLRRRVGSAFTLEELSSEYRRAEAWAREAVAELPPADRWPPGLATATDAAFHLYSRGARDYDP